MIAEDVEVSQTRTGSEILADALKNNGVDLIYHVPGESFISVLDALKRHHGDIRQVSCRHEGGMAVMAEAYGKLSGRPGIAFVTRSPGATNAASGIHTAFQDSSPMILFIGQVIRSQMEREAFQSYDFRQMFAPMAKWVAQIDDAARIPEFVQRAFHMAMSPRPGPVVLVLPEDMLEDQAAVDDADPVRAVAGAAPSSESLEQLRGMLDRADRPVMMVGGPGWSNQTRDQVQQFVDANDIPVVTTFRRRDIIDNRHRCYAGEIGIGANPKLLECIRNADLVIVLNDSLSEVNSIGEKYMLGFTLFGVPRPQQKLVHIQGAIEELNRVYQADLAILADVDRMAESLAAMEPVDAIRRRDWTETLHQVNETDFTTSSCPGPLDLAAVFKGLRERLPDDAILTNGVGAYAGWSQRYFRHHALQTQLGPISGVMGYGVPAAISAKLLYPERIVVAVTGDGCFLMTAEELATAVKYKVGIVIVLINNNMYGTIRIHQEKSYGGRVAGTDLTNPDFVAYAKAFGLHSELVERTEEFAPAFERALGHGGPALIEMAIDPDAIHTRYSLSSLQQRG
jgi:acetolactate synthase-1/2/3 large subunit